MQINQVLHLAKIHRIVETNHVYYYKIEKFEIFRDEGGEIKARINNDTIERTLKMIFRSFVEI